MITGLGQRQQNFQVKQPAFGGEKSPFVGAEMPEIQGSAGSERPRSSGYLGRDLVRFAATVPVAPRFGLNTEAPVSADNPFGLDPTVNELSGMLRSFVMQEYHGKGLKEMIEKNIYLKPTQQFHADTKGYDAEATRNLFRAKYQPVLDMVKRLGRELGVIGADVPEAYGGMGGDAMYGVEVARQLGYVDAGLATTALASKGLFGMPLLAIGTEEQKQKYLPEILTGDKIGAFALTEPDSGSDAGAMKATARRTEDGKWVLNGSKTFISNGNTADYYVVFARVIQADGQPSKESTVFVLEKDDAGLHTQDVGHKMGLHTSDTAIVSMDDVVVDDSRVVGGEAGIGKGGFIYNNTLVGGRAGVAAMATGVAERAQDIAVKYIRDRKQFGMPIGMFPMLREMIADNETGILVSKLLAYHGTRFKNDCDQKDLAAREAARESAYESTAVKLRDDLAALRETAAEAAAERAVNSNPTLPPDKLKKFKARAKQAALAALDAKRDKAAEDKLIHETATRHASVAANAAQDAIESSRSAPPYAKQASMAKFYATEHTSKVADNSVQVHGGNGFMTEYEAERLMRDARVFRIYEGTTQVQKMIIAREVLSDAKFNPEDFEFTARETSPQTEQDVVNRAFKLAVKKNEEGLNQLGNVVMYMMMFQGKVDKMVKIATLRQGLELLTEHVDRLKAAGVPSAKEEAILKVFAHDAAAESLDLLKKLGVKDAVLRNAGADILETSGETYEATKATIADGVIGPLG